MAAARSPERTVVSAQRGSESVFDATYLGRMFKASAMRPLPPATNTSAPIRHRLPDFFRGLSGTPAVSDRQRDGFGATALHFLMRAQCGRALGPDRSRSP